MKKYYLGEFEEVVLLAIAILYKSAYGVAIKEQIEGQLDRGYIRSSTGESTEERAGRPRNYYEITATGKKAIAYARESREKMWRAIPKIVLELSAVLK
jgi:PadR family transcriptional regulator, regulatory protein PadR